MDPEFPAPLRIAVEIARAHGLADVDVELLADLDVGLEGSDRADSQEVLDEIAELVATIDTLKADDGDGDAAPLLLRLYGDLMLLGNLADEENRRASAKRCLVRDLNENITCRICSGYLINATTVKECIHTFCKSCIVKHLKDSNRCPECNKLIHQSNPLDYIGSDRTLQDLVYKIVPNLEGDELDREFKFYADCNRKEGARKPLIWEICNMVFGEDGKTIKFRRKH